ncbi:hypothetical protein TWF730_000122 [Orbilia blumenaviensis]|uniref:Uncharacterized protein n=1 Tax=Orbilia blumenaviensis TaxID=1796055 RepID=A0AAV9VKY0_9PEZI
MAYVGPARRLQGVYCHEHWSPVGYPLLSSNYAYMVRDVFVEATLTETYQASTNTEREVSYIFEIPPEASVTSFSAEVGGVRVESIVEEKVEADKKYQEAKRAGAQAWKLDKVNDEIFQISLGNVKPDSSIIIRITYFYVISSNTIEDSIRLTIPAGLATRSGAGPATETTRPTAASGTSAVTITVGIEAAHKKSDGDDDEKDDHILNLNCLSHLSAITYGFSDKSFEGLTPVQMQDRKLPWKAFVEFTSNQFLDKHYVLVWTVPRIDQPRCLVEPFEGRPDTVALALTLVSNIDLDPEEHEYIFLVDYSVSMRGGRIQAANDIVKTMLNNLPTKKKSSFNIYNFNTSAWPIVSGTGGHSLGYDTTNVTNAINQLKTNVSGETNINAALTTVMNQRDISRPRCSIIVITGGLDWGVATAMKTVQNNVTAAAAKSKLLRVFVVGLGDDVSRGMCEALARAGSGATVYISESQLGDNQTPKARTLINSINRAPIRVRSIDWGMRRPPAQDRASGNNLSSRSEANQDQFGAAAKGNNLPPPEDIQQAPLPGSLYWAVRSYWYVIFNGDINEDLTAKIIYDVLGSGQRTIQVAWDDPKKGRLIHCLAARALIQTFEDKEISISDPNDKYWNECEIVRLGKTYKLASTKTSFVATMNGIGTRTSVTSNIPDGSRSAFSVVPSNTGLALENTSTPSSASVAGPAFSPPTTSPFNYLLSFASLPADIAPQDDWVDISAQDGNDPSGVIAAQDNDSLSAVLAAQDGNGAFDSSAVGRIVFPNIDVPPIPAFISILEGRDEVKKQIWLAICVIAFFQKKHAEDSSRWSTAQSRAKEFVETTLCCIFGIGPDESKDIFGHSLDDATGYFY